MAIFLNEILQLYANNSLIDKVAMLEVLIIGKTTQSYSEYYAKINMFMNNYPNSDLYPLAKELRSQISQEDLKKGYIKGRIQYQEENQENQK